MSSSVLKQIHNLKSLDHEGLCALWRALYAQEPPVYNRRFLTSRLAYRIQELAYGGLSEEAKSKMSTIISGDQLCSTSASVRKQVPVQKQQSTKAITGTKFIRDWNGTRYEVIAVNGGFEYDGKIYRSLSAIAKAITGTHWNGKLFFGVAKNSNGRKIR